MNLYIAYETLFCTTLGVIGMTALSLWSQLAGKWIAAKITFLFATLKYTEIKSLVLARDVIFLWL